MSFICSLLSYIIFIKKYGGGGEVIRACVMDFFDEITEYVMTVFRARNKDENPSDCIEHMQQI